MLLTLIYIARLESFYSSSSFTALETFLATRECILSKALIGLWIHPEWTPFGAVIFRSGRLQNAVSVDILVVYAFDGDSWLQIIHYKNKVCCLRYVIRSSEIRISYGKNCIWKYFMNESCKMFLCHGHVRYELVPHIALFSTPICL